MPNKIKVSVIIPIYNAEAYLNRCIESVVNQTYRNIEIILVDDGSSDNSPNLCDEWAKKDSRIRVIHKQNEGHGIARNYGIKIATGQYVCFSDSDDYIELTTVEIALSAILETGAQAVVYGYDKVSSAGEIIHSQKPSVPKRIFEGDEVKKILLPMALSNNAVTGENWNLWLSACSGLFSMDVIRKNNWKFVSERNLFSEDFYSIGELYGYLNKVCIIDDILYHYVQNENSFTHKYNPERHLKIDCFFNGMKSLSEKIDCKKELEAPIRTIYLGFVIWALKQIVNSNETFLERYKYLKNIIKGETLQNQLKLHKYNGENISKKILFSLLKKRMIFFSFIIIKLRNLKKF